MIKYTRRGRRMADPNAAAKPRRKIIGKGITTEPKKPKTMADPFKSRNAAPTRDTSKAVVAGGVDNPNARNLAKAQKNNAGASSTRQRTASPNLNRAPTQRQAFNQQQNRNPMGPQRDIPNQLTQSKQFRNANNRGARLQMLIDENQSMNQNQRQAEEQRRRSNEPTAAQLLSKRDARAAYEAKKKAEAEAKRKAAEAKRKAAAEAAAKKAAAEKAAAAKKAPAKNRLRYESMDEVMKDYTQFDKEAKKLPKTVDQFSYKTGKLRANLLDQVKELMAGLPKAKPKPVDPVKAAKKAKEKEIIAKLFKKKQAEAAARLKARKAQAAAKAGGGYMDKNYVNPTHVMEDRIANKQKAKQKAKKKDK